MSLIYPSHSTCDKTLKSLKRFAENHENEEEPNYEKSTVPWVIVSFCLDTI